MTRQEALDYAAERGHAMEKTTIPEDAAYLTWTCSECGCRVLIFGLAIYGSALERDCSTVKAA